MTSYRFRRRAFLTAVSGGVGLKIMLRNLESAAQGVRSPARLLITHWPIGIVPGSSEALWKPTAGSVGGSPGLKPFADAGLGPDMTVIRGLTTGHLNAAGGGGHEAGTVLLVTGRSAVGVRMNIVEPDDAIAAPGGSYDQILLENAPSLKGAGTAPGYANSIADSRTDTGEISTKTLSYSTREMDVNLYAGAGTVRGSTPLAPVLSPLQQYTALFANFVPGTAGAGGGGGGGAGGTGGGPPRRVADATLKKLVGKRSVLDFAVEELNQLKRIGPADARNKLTNHSDAIVAAERSVVDAINAGYPSSGSGGSSAGGAGGAGGSSGGTCACSKQPAPSPQMGQPDWTSGVHGNYDTGGRGGPDDASVHAQVGKAHLDVLKAAFICDLIRVGTFQWAPGTSHVGFTMLPGDTNAYQHHPISHRIGGAETTASATVAGLNPVAQFMFNVQTWYFARHAENLASWKNAVDGCGNNLLDFTCVPFLTEVRTLSHERTNMPAMIIGGKKLGFLHDRYVTDPITINQLWGTIAQAFGHTSTAAPFAPPVPGFWAPP
jgi:hypothetical protein